MLEESRGLKRLEPLVNPGLGYRIGSRLAGTHQSVIGSAVPMNRDELYNSGDPSPAPGDDRLYRGRGRSALRRQVAG